MKRFELSLHPIKRNRTKAFCIKMKKKQKVVSLMLSENEKYNHFVNDFSEALYNLKMEVPFSDYIFLCVGSDKIIGDTYGPLVGEKLKGAFTNMYHNIYVYGTLEEPISAMNLEKTVQEIYRKFSTPCIIAVDSALGSDHRIGNIFVSNSKMQCGKGTGKKMLYVGDISIKGVVGKDYKIPKYNFSGLQSIPLGSVMKLADITATRHL